MALMNYARQWLYNRFRYSPNAAAIHDGLDDSLNAIDTDVAEAESRTILDEADAAGLALWGGDLDEVRLQNQSDDQYQGALAAVYRGHMVNREAGADVLAKYGLTGVLIDRGDPDVFADLAFADVEAMTILGPPTYAHFALLYDEWDPDSGLSELDFAQRCINSATNLFRTKAAGVCFTPLFPSAVTA